jgi:hypothetical protein
MPNCATNSGSVAEAALIPPAVAPPDVVIEKFAATSPRQCHVPDGPGGPVSVKGVAHVPSPARKSPLKLRFRN